MPDYSKNCYRGCGRVAVVIEGDERFCAKCWMKWADDSDPLSRVWSLGWMVARPAAVIDVVVR